MDSAKASQRLFIYIYAYVYLYIYTLVYVHIYIESASEYRPVFFSENRVFYTFLEVETIKSIYYHSKLFAGCQCIISILV